MMSDRSSNRDVQQSTSDGNQLMQYRTLGRTGVQVSSLVLGAMNFGAIGRTTQDEATATSTPHSRAVST
jgi:hypothetical protein